MYYNRFVPVNNFLSITQYYYLLAGYIFMYKKVTYTEFNIWKEHFEQLSYIKMAPYRRHMSIPLLETHMKSRPLIGCNTFVITF